MATWDELNSKVGGKAQAKGGWDALNASAIQSKQQPILAKPNYLLPSSPILNSVSVPEPKIQFGLPNSMPAISMGTPQTANTTRQLVTPAPLQVNAPVQVAGLQSLIPRNRDSQVIRSPLLGEGNNAKPRGTLATALLGNEQDKAVLRDMQSRGINPGFFSTWGTEGFLSMLGRSKEEQKNRLADSLIAKGVEPNRAIETAYQELERRDIGQATKDRASGAPIKRDIAVKRLAELELTPQEKMTARLQQYGQLAGSALDVADFATFGTTKPLRKVAVKKVGQVVDNLSSKVVAPKPKTIATGKPDPAIKTKRDVPTKTISGEKLVIPAGTKLNPIVDGGKVNITVGGKSYAIPKNQYQNLVGQSDVAKATPFAPELNDTMETVYGAGSRQPVAVKDKAREKLATMGYTFENDMSGEAILIYRGDIVEYDNLSVSNKKLVDEAVGSAETFRDMEIPTKYSNYTLPGGEKYREILIQAPETLKKGEYGTDVIDTSKRYRSSHWSEPNVISHLRMNERTVDGKKYAFMEELQSDWAREMRDGKTTATNDLLKNWQIPTTKRALMEAVDSGADRFAWINGEQTSARYNLATHVDNVKWNQSVPKKVFADDVIDKTKTGIHIELQPKNGGQIIVNTDKKGTITNSSTKDWEGKKLDEVLGKGLADKIMEKETGTLAGDGLSFGGEWAKNLYDRQVRDIVKKLTGAEVKTVDLGLGDGKKKPLVYANKADGSLGKKLTLNEIKKGQAISATLKRGEAYKPYVVTDVLSDGKIQVVEKDFYDSMKARWFDMEKDSNWESRLSTGKETFDLSESTATQQYIELTPEVKAKIQSEAPKLKLSDVSTENIPLIFRSLLDNTKLNTTISQATKDLEKIFGVKGIIKIKGVPFFEGNADKLGEMRNGIITLLEQNGKVSDVIAKHEGWHLFKNGLVTADEKAFIIKMENELVQKFPDKVAKLRKAGYEEYEIAEELMADEFARFYRTGKTFSEKLATIFSKLIQRLEMIWANKSEVIDYFKNVSTKTTGQLKPNRVVKNKQISEIDRLIAENKVRVVSRNGRDVYQIKKANNWVSVRDEDSAIRQVTKKPILAKPKTQLPDELEMKLVELDVAKEALDNNPAKGLARYVAKRGNSKGLLAEVTGKQNSKTGFGVDARTADAGFDNSEDARKAYEKYLVQKQEYAQRKTDLAQEIAQYKKPAKYSAEGIPLSTRSLKKSNRPILVQKAQVASLEEAAQQALNKVDSSIRQDIPSLPEIIKIEPTSVKKKINALDYIRTPNRVLEKIGLGKEARLLRTQYDKYTLELPKNIDKITAWSKRVPKASDQRLFDYLDGKDIKLSPEEKRVATEMRAYFDEWADRLKLPKANRVTHYITHLFDDQLIAKEFDEDLAKIIGEKIPGEVYDPFLLARLGAKGYKRNVWKALDAYTKRATRKVHLDVALENIQMKTGSSLEYSRLEESQYKYVKNYIDRVQMRPTELDNLVDNTVKQVIGYKFGQRPVTSISRFLRQMTYRGMLGGNLGSAVRNLSQGANNYAVLGEKYTVIGYAKLFSPTAKKELVEQGVLASNFIEDRALSSTRKALQRIDKGLWFFFDQAEKINRGAAYHGAKAKAINAGKTEEQAVEYAKRIVRKTQFSYDAVDQPVIAGSDLAKTLFQFQTFTTKQSEFLIEMAKDKNFLGLLRYALAGYLFVSTIGKAMGMEPKELLPIYRFDVPPSLKLPVEAIKAAVDAPDAYGNQRDWKKKASDIGKAALGLIPGGIQARKTYQGAEAVREGGSFTKSDTKQFEVGGTPAKDTQAYLFGKYASKEAKNYFNDVKTPEQKLKAEKAAENKADRDKMQPAYNQVQQLVREGKTEEATQIIEAMSDADYEVYKRIRTNERSKHTEDFRLKLELDPKKAVEYLRSLDKAEAERIINLMTDEEYARYEEGKS